MPAADSFGELRESKKKDPRKGKKERKAVTKAAAKRGRTGCSAKKEKKTFST